MNRLLFQLTHILALENEARLSESACLPITICALGDTNEMVFSVRSAAVPLRPATTIVLR